MNLAPTYKNLRSVFGINKFQTECLLAYSGNLETILKGDEKSLKRIPSIGDKTAAKIARINKTLKIAKEERILIAKI